MKLIAAIMLLLPVSCGGQKPNRAWKREVGIVTEPTGAWMPASANDAAPQYKHALMTVKQRLTKHHREQDRPVVDCEYDVRVRDGDMWIRVFNILGYFEDVDPAASPGAHRTFVVSTNPVIDKVIPEA